jgi:hypothetical protein
VCVEEFNLNLFDGGAETCLRVWCMQLEEASAGQKPAGHTGRAGDTHQPHTGEFAYTSSGL